MEGDGEGLLFSGDEDELPSESELQQQLGKIYLKDQLDQDKKQLRLFKEMYLKDGELHEQDKHARRKQFRWKHLDNENGGAMYSEDEETDQEEDGEEEENENEPKGGLREDRLKRKFLSKKNKSADEEANWRLIRHERELISEAKLRQNDLLSDDDEASSNNRDEESEYSEQSRDTFFTSSLTGSNGASGGGNQLLKMGQMLLMKQQKQQGNAYFHAF